MPRSFLYILSVISLVIAVFFIPSISAFAQSDLVSEVTLSYEEQLAKLKQDLGIKESERKELQKAISSETDDEIKAQLEQELRSADELVSGLRDEIIELSTGGVELFEAPLVVKREFDWKKDLELIFDPILSQLRQLGERPRRIEQLQADIVFWENRELELDAAIDNLTSNLDLISDKTLKRDVQALLDTALSKASSAEQRLSLLKKDLSELQKEKNPIWVTLSDVFTNIILTTLLHFSVALIVAFLSYQSIRFLSLIPIYIIVKRNPGETVFAERAIVVVRVILGAAIAVMAYFIALYSFSEWLILVISLLLLAGVALALKNTLPKYFVEIKTMLNMGSIRQGERLIFQGLPWKITRLNVHTRLHNPALHGHLRVPLEDIVNCSSRPYHDDEPWFPTAVNDVIMLEDGAFGKVLRQSPDMVEIDFGGSVYSYQALDFLSRRPRNLTRSGFMIYETFGFDYQHQAEITTTILTTYRAAIKTALNASPYAEYNTYIDVEFDNASASSLDFKILAAFTGELGADYFKIKRFFQNASVDIANKHGWVIPFQQITIHHQPVS